MTDKNVLRAEELRVIFGEKFGGVYLGMTIKEFDSLGFEYGDSVDVVFSTGYSIRDIPYYNGFYTKVGNPLLVSYPGFPYIDVSYNNGYDVITHGKLSESDTCTVTLRERGKYSATQNLLNLSYTNVREDYDSDETFANFRCVRCGRLKDNLLYRSVSPCNNLYNRAPYADRLLRENGITFVIDLGDREGEHERYAGRPEFENSYYKTLLDSSRVVAAGLGSDYRGEAYARNIALALEKYASVGGKFLVHCTEGKDRTGFVCALLGAIAGAGYGELEDDYMLTYRNYYGVTKEKYPERYAEIVSRKLDDILAGMLGLPIGASPAGHDLEHRTEDYLLRAGMSSETLSRLKEIICI